MAIADGPEARSGAEHAGRSTPAVSDRAQEPTGVAAARRGLRDRRRHPLLDDLVALDEAAEEDGAAYDLIEIVTHSSETVMGNAGMDHEHAAQPRHVRTFGDYVADVAGSEPGEPRER